MTNVRYLGINGKMFNGNILKNVKETYKREKTKSNSPVTNSSISRTVSGIGDTF